MDLHEIDRLLNQIVGAANSVLVCGEENMAQLMGVCRAARQIHQMIHKEAGEDGG